VDVERRRRRGLHGADVLAQHVWRGEADADGADAAGPADGDGEVGRQASEGHAGAGEGVAYAEALRETRGNRRDGGHGGLLAAVFNRMVVVMNLRGAARRDLGIALASTVPIVR